MFKKYIFKIVLPAAALILILATLIIACFVRDGDEVIEAYTSKKEEAVNILLLGNDRASGLADVIMLISLDANENSACVMQIPRDTYMMYGDENHRKINSASVGIGNRELCKKLEASLGVEIEGYISLDLDAFRKVVDTVGGVEMEIKQRLYYNDPEQGLYIDLPRGTHLLDGNKAEMLVRYRSGYSGGDIARLDVQKEFLAAFIKKVKSEINPSNIYGIACSILPHLKTNISAPKLVCMGIKALKISTDRVSMLTLPGEAVTSTNSGASFFIMSAPATKRALRDYFGKSDDAFDENKIFVKEDYKIFLDVYKKDRDLKISVPKS